MNLPEIDLDGDLFEIDVIQLLACIRQLDEMVHLLELRVEVLERRLNKR